MDEEEFCGEVTSSDARRRNLLFMIVKSILKNSIDLKKTFTKDEIGTLFYFRKSDFAFYIDDFFCNNNGNYQISSNQRVIIENILKEHKAIINKLGSAKSIYIKTFGRFHEEYENNKSYNFDFSKLNLIYEKISTVIPILHWGMLPIIPDCLMINSGRIPENNVILFYDHFHMLEALLREINGEGEKMMLKGDLNLDKPLTFSVYSRRWGHIDNYRMKRTIDGWNVSHISINGKCKKNGEGALFNNLRHDSIFYLVGGVGHALEMLWNEADENEMSVEELQVKLQQIADWISDVEKVVGEKQPDWVNYY